MSLRHLFLLATMLLAGAGLAAQQPLPTHILTGRVTDRSGKALPGVTVELTTPGANDSARTVVTDRAGTYRLDRVVPGIYVLSFRMPGLAPVVRDLEVGGGPEEFRFDVQMRTALPETSVDARQPTRRVICGMTVISPPPGQTIDKGLIVPKAPPGSPPVKPTIRAVQPSICWEPAVEPLPAAPNR